MQYLPVLVELLREADDEGSPLLFFAAACHRLRCFKAVVKQIRNTLGDGGLKEQVLAINRNKKTIMMFAVRSRSLKVYTEVTELVMRQQKCTYEPGSPD